jgi:hypothetical protein
MMLTVRATRIVCLALFPFFSIAAYAQEPGAPPVACTDEAKLCSDGSAVGRTGPHCEFSPCPGESGKPGGPICNMGPMRCPDGSLVYPGPSCQFSPCPGGSSGSGEPGAIGGSGGSGIASPGKIVHMEDVGLSKYPDLPLAEVPSEPQTVEFVAQHRTALNGRRITLQGVIVSALLGERACPTNPMMGMPCAQPRIVLASTDNESRDANYDTMVVLQANDKTAYEVGEDVEITGTVLSGKSSVTIRKDYDPR